MSHPDAQIGLGARGGRREAVADHGTHFARRFQIGKIRWIESRTATHP